MILFAGLSMIWPQNIKGKITSFSQFPYKLKVSFRNQSSWFGHGLLRHRHLTGHNIGRDQFHECSTTLAMTHDLTRWTNVLSHIPLGTNQVSIRIHILGHSKVVELDLGLGTGIISLQFVHISPLKIREKIELIFFVESNFQLF